MKKLISSLLALLFSSISIFATSRVEITDSLRNALAFVNTPADSLKLLYDIFDLENAAAQRYVNGMAIYQVAGRAGDMKAQLDMLRQMAVGKSTDLKALRELRRKADAFPISDEVRDTKLFLDLYIIMTQVRSSSVAERQKQLAGILSRYDRKEGNWYDKVRNLYTLCAYLSVEGTPNLLADYLDRLGRLINEKPDLHYSVRNFYYTSAAIHFTEGDRPYKAVEADRHLLREIEDLEKQYASKKRMFRNYDVQKYVSYRRMLQNYRVLDLKEVKKYYSEILRLRSINPTVADDFNTWPKAQAYYYMAIKDFHRAIPAIKKLIHTVPDKNLVYRRQLLQMLMEAAKATGDEATLREATEDFNNIQKQIGSDETRSLYRELQIKYDVNQLKAQKTALELEKRNNQIRMTRTIIWIVSIAFIVVLVLLVILFFSYRHTRSLSRHLSVAVEKLKEERDTLNKIQAQLIRARDKAEAANVAKDEFLHSMSHEIRTPLNAIMGFSQLLVKKLPTPLGPKLKNFSHQIISNTEILEVLINDILYLSSIDRHVPAPSVDSASASTLLSIAAQWVSYKVKPGVYVDCSMPRPDIVLHSDRGSIEEVLMKLLSNAAKFTDNGSIRLECRDNKDEGTVSFIISDTGPGIPDGYEEEIFQRFVKLDSFKQGTGLGLHICRRLAESLGGKVYVDKSYSDGARFIFTIPKDISQSAF